VTPPPLPGQFDEQKLRAATAANIFLPGTGLFILGHRKTGAAFAVLFLLCFLSVLIVFLVGYANYLSAAMDADILKNDRLESIGEGFHKGWLLTLAGLGGVIYLAAVIQFKRIKNRIADKPENQSLLNS
jgi:hypothetical protein